jgi:signal transduction histidine kinase
MKQVKGLKQVKRTVQKYILPRDIVVDNLQRENEALISLNRSKDEFVALASHQLRTPATAVRQYLGLLLEGYAEPLTENQRGFIENAYESNERQLRLVEEILRVVKIDLDKLPLHKKPIDLASLIKRAANSLRSVLDEKEHQLTLHIKNAVQIEADPQQLILVFENLLENAINYTPAKGKIEISLSRTNKWAVVRFKDNGVGIDPEDYSKLFQKFSRVSNELSESVNGSGLGLYFCRKIIELHGGSIVASNSKRKKGTVFKILLPLKVRDNS